MWGESIPFDSRYRETDSGRESMGSALEIVLNNDDERYDQGVPLVGWALPADHIPVCGAYPMGSLAVDYDPSMFIR